MCCMCCMCCAFGVVVVTNLLLFFLGICLYLGVGWGHGSTFGISGGTPRGGAAAAGAGSRHRGEGTGECCLCCACGLRWW
jgi:hypothetical protein